MQLLPATVINDPKTDALKRELANWEIVKIDRVDGSVIIRRKTGA